MSASLKESYKNHFAIGAAINPWQTKDPAYSALIRKQFSSITAENDMKPERVLDYRKTLEAGDEILTAQNYEKVDEMLAFARDNGIRVRFHVLCWHNQTPLWFFTKGWQDVSREQLMQEGFRPDFAPREVLLARQEAYIRDVMTHVNANFPGVVYCWDVVNEAIEPDQGEKDGFRVRSPWYQALGSEFIFSAFRAARKYQAPGQQLFYNDYNCYQPEKLSAILALLRRLKAENLVDGMGMQGHLLMDWPSIEECETAARAYAALGISVQVTELDIHCPDGSPEGKKALADRYRAYFDMLLKVKRDGADINCATFWGVTDRDSWLPGFRKSESYPLLFDAEGNTKPAFDSVVEVAGKY